MRAKITEACIPLDMIPGLPQVPRKVLVVAVSNSARTTAAEQLSWRPSGLIYVSKESFDPFLEDGRKHDRGRGRDQMGWKERVFGV